MAITPRNINEKTVSSNHHWEIIRPHGRVCMHCGKINRKHFNINDNLCPGLLDDRWHSNTTNDDFAIISLEHYRKAIIELTNYGKSVGYDDLYPDNTDFECRVEQDYYDGPQAWTLDPDRISAYLKLRYDN